LKTVVLDAGRVLPVWEIAKRSYEIEAGKLRNTAKPSRLDRSEAAKKDWITIRKRRIEQNA